MVAARARLVEAVLLNDAERRVNGYDAVQAERIRLLSAAASARVAASRKLGAPSLDPVVAKLLADAVALRREAARVAGVADTEESANTDLAYYDALPRRELLDVIESLRRAEKAGRDAVEHRSVAYIRGARFGRTAALAVIAAWLIVTLVSWWRAPPNVAGRRSLVIQGVAHTPEQFVDGVRETLTPAWIVGDAPSVAIDLAGPYAIDSVRMYNREDGSYDTSLPIDLETSLDGVKWKLQERRRDHFTVWKVPLHGERARYVRVRSETRQLALNEIEVYGRFSR